MRIVVAGMLGVLLAACAVETEIGELGYEVRLCADGPTVEGIDVSKWQQDIDWDAVAAAGVRFAFIRTNHGLGDLDEKYAYNWSEARRVGILRGTYQYYLPSEDPIAQADLLLERMGPLEPDDLPPVLDVEEADGQSPEQIRAGVIAWTEHVEAELGVTPIIYTAKYFWQDGVGAPDDFLDHPLWVANYNVDCPLMADPWPRWDFWQYTSTGSIAGIAGNVDRDHFNGSYEDLLAFIAATRITDPPDLDPAPEPDRDPSLDPDPASDSELPPGGVTPSLGCSVAAGGGSTRALLALALAVLLIGRRRRG